MSHDRVIRLLRTATAMGSLAWVFSSQERRPVPGVSHVRLVWTDGRLRIPLHLWCRGEPSQDAWALEWLSDARHRLRCHPAYVLCDVWSPSKALLPRIRDDGWPWRQSAL